MVRWPLKIGCVDDDSDKVKKQFNFVTVKLFRFSLILFSQNLVKLNWLD